MRRHIFKIPAILYSIMIFYLSSLTQNEIPRVNIFAFDKIVHLTEYLIFGMTLMLAYTRAKGALFNKNASTASILSGVLYAVSDEIHQLFVPGRDCNIIDFSADALGIVAGVYLFTKISKYQNLNDELLFRKTSHK